VKPSELRFPLKISPAISLEISLFELFDSLKSYFRHLVKFRVCALLATDSCARFSFLRATVHTLQQSLCTPCKWKLYTISSELMSRNRLSHSLQQILTQDLSSCRRLCTPCSSHFALLAKGKFHAISSELSESKQTLSTHSLRTVCTPCMNSTKRTIETYLNTSQFHILNNITHSFMKTK
jgi:hypothetical protein